MTTLSDRDVEKHVWYFSQCLRLLPHQYDSLDANRMTAAYFCLMGLDVLDRLEDAFSVVPKDKFIDWIYNLQVLPDASDSERLAKYGGFQGGTFVGKPFDPCPTSYSPHLYGPSHIANTYTALAMLLALGDDLSRVNKGAVLKGLRALQQEDGSFNAVCVGSEHDVRFAYCACAISYMLNDWSGIDVPKATRWILSCQRYEASFGMVPGQEGHGGTTYCALAALKLLGKLESIDDKEGLIQWCTRRQIGGLQGRTNKKADTCYSFWVGASLHMLGAVELLAPEPLIEFIGKCKCAVGGYSKVVGIYPDVLHSFYSLCGLSLVGCPRLLPLEPTLGMTARAAEWCETVRARLAAKSEAADDAAADTSEAAGASLAAGAGPDASAASGAGAGSGAGSGSGVGSSASPPSVPPRSVQAADAPPVA